MDPRAGKKEKEVTIQVSHQSIPPIRKGVRCRGMLLVLPGNYHELHRSPFHSQRSYKTKGHTAFMVLRQHHKKSGNASLLTIKNDIPTGGTQSHLLVTTVTQCWFPERLLYLYQRCLKRSMTLPRSPILVPQLSYKIKNFMFYDGQDNESGRARMPHSSRVQIDISKSALK
jgi:hypothetical protein